MSFTFLLPYLFELDAVYHVEGEALYLIFLYFFFWWGGRKESTLFITVNCTLKYHALISMGSPWNYVTIISKPICMLESLGVSIFVSHLFLVFVYLLLVVVCQNISNWNHQSTRNTGNWFTWCVWHSQSSSQILKFCICWFSWLVKRMARKRGSLVGSGRYCVTFWVSYLWVQ